MYEEVAPNGVRLVADKPFHAERVWDRNAVLFTAMCYKMVFLKTYRFYFKGGRK